MMVDLSVHFSWREIGQVELDSQDKLKFPKSQPRPGLYRFELAKGGVSQTYIGETDTLDRRFQHYRTPGPSQVTNLRLNALMREVIASGGSVAVYVHTEGAVVAIEGDRKPPRLDLKPNRVLLEHAAIYAAREAGSSLLNI